MINTVCTIVCTIIICVLLVCFNLPETKPIPTSVVFGNTFVISNRIKYIEITTKSNRIILPWKNTNPNNPWDGHLDHDKMTEAQEDAIAALVGGSGNEK